ncbi:uncharacterized protein [Diadema antillarum]|uniref:uncharacterized protein n=1 Tax=Diadema antillarum TaxID=105358 RepID=UPI003A8AB08A
MSTPLSIYSITAPRHAVDSSSGDESAEEIECPSFVRDKTITRALNDYEDTAEDGQEPYFTWDATTISQHLAKYLDDLCGWVPDARLQYRRVPSQSKSGQKNHGGGSSKGGSRTDSDTHPRRLSITSRASSRMKTMAIEFEFRHYHNPKKYMEQYRRFHTCGGPLEKLAAQDTACGRKRSIYYAGDASAHAGFKPDLAQPKPEPRLAAQQIAAAAATAERVEMQRLSQSRPRHNSDSKTENQPKTESNHAGASTALPPPSTAPSAPAPADGPASEVSGTTLPRYCSLTEAASRKRQTFAHWSPGLIKDNSRSVISKFVKDNEHLLMPSIPQSLTVTADVSSQSAKPQSRSPPGLRPMTTAASLGSRASNGNVRNGSPSSSGLTDQANTIPQHGPPVGQHPFWKPSVVSQFPATADNHTLPVAFGFVTRLPKYDLHPIDEELSDCDDWDVAPNNFTGVTRDDSCYGYHPETMGTPDGSVFRDFYSHLLQAAHYLRVAGRQRSIDKTQQPLRQQSSSAIYKSPKLSAADDNSTEASIPAQVVHTSHGLGIRGQRLNSAASSIASRSATCKSAGPLSSSGSSQYVNAPAFKSTHPPKQSSTPIKITSQHETNSPTTFSRKKYISIDSPTSMNRGEMLKTGTSGADSSTDPINKDRITNNHMERGKGNVYHISIPEKPCRTESTPTHINKAALCQAVCLESVSKEAIAIGNTGQVKR